MRYAVWVTKDGEALRYQDRPQAYLDPQEGSLHVGSLPRGTDRVRIGVRAMDVAGNLSPPGEVELELPPASSPSAPTAATSGPAAESDRIR